MHFHQDMAFEKYVLPQGNIMIAFSDEKLSVGTLTLNPKQELAKHNRPVLESLFQLKGKCTMKIEKNGETREIVLNEGESLDIEPGTIHMHTNPFDEESLTFWKANGDIRDIIEAIRETNKM